MSYKEITNSNQLSILLKQIYPKFESHVVAVDQLPTIEPKPLQLIIVNYKEKDQRGTHWVGIAIREAKYVVYYDSYALPPPEKILEFLRRYKDSGIAREIAMNIRKIQPTLGIGSKACGWFIFKFFEQYIKKRDPVYKAITNVSVRNTLAYAKKLSQRYYYFLLAATKPKLE